MRYIQFTVEQKRYYELCLQGTSATTREIDVKREGRRYDTLMGKLEDGGINGELIEDRVVALEDAEYELMVDCLEKVKWTNQGVREAFKMLEWLKEAATKPLLAAE